MKKKKGGGGANWMDTYGDMVTLLLCFFVLLYSMSTLDQQKWIQLVQSFNPDATPEVTDNMGNGGQYADPVTGPDQSQVDANMEELFENLKAYVAAQGAGENISVTKGDGYVFISFNDAVFFDGDSYVLREEGEKVLTDVGQMLGQASNSIDEVRILGHTAQASPDELNNPTTDRFLASNRATVALVYLQEMNVIDPARLVSLGCGQWRPVSSNDTSESRAKNRRVEMIVAGKDVENSMGDSIAQYYTQRGTEPPAGVTPASSGSGGETGSVQASSN